MTARDEAIAAGAEALVGDRVHEVEYKAVFYEEAARVLDAAVASGAVLWADNPIDDPDSEKVRRLASTLDLPRVDSIRFLYDAYLVCANSVEGDEFHLKAVSRWFDTAEQDS